MCVKASKRIASAFNFRPATTSNGLASSNIIEQAEQRLKIVVPFTLADHFRSHLHQHAIGRENGIVLLAVPFSLIGAFWLLWMLGYNMSVAVWVGLIALAGLDAETGVVMLLYLDHAWEKFRAEGRMKSMRDLRAAITRERCTRPSEDHDRLRDPFWFAADHVVARHASRRRRHETHRHADDRRRSHFDASGVAHLPDNLLNVARAESRW